VDGLPVHLYYSNKSSRLVGSLFANVWLALRECLAGSSQIFKTVRDRIIDINNIFNVESNVRGYIKTMGF
jgi:hypothetical protein